MKHDINQHDSQIKLTKKELFIKYLMTDKGRLVTLDEVFDSEIPQRSLSGHERTFNLLYNT